MTNGKKNTLRIFIGILGAGAIALSIVLFSAENAGEIFKSAIMAAWQIDMGLLLLIYGINENMTKGKPKGNMYFVVGLAVLTSTIYTINNLFIKLAQ